MSRGQARLLLVEDPGALLTVQDLGRPGLAAIGVAESGALDPDALRLANRLVGNREDAAGLEATYGGVVLHCRGGTVLAATGAPGAVMVDGRARDFGVAVHVRDGARVEIGRPHDGLRTYLAVRGGLTGRGVLGSASTDLLSGLGGAPLRPGAQLSVGPEPGSPVPAQEPVAPRPTPGSPLFLDVVLGPRADWFTDDACDLLTSTTYTVGSRSDRIGIRLQGAPLTRRTDRELPSEGTVAGSLQVPASGLPTLFLADHPVTGGYPVIAVVRTRDLPLAAQAEPGTSVRLRAVTGPVL